MPKQDAQKQKAQVQQQEQKEFFRNDVLKGIIIGKDEKPFFQTKIQVWDKEAKKNVDHSLLLPLTLDDGDKEVLRGWYQEKKKNHAFMAVRYDDNDPLNVEKYEQKQFTFGNESLKSKRCFYHFFTNKAEKPELFISMESYPIPDRAKIAEMVNANNGARIHAYIVFAEQTEKGQVFYPINGASCSPIRVIKGEPIPAEDYMKKVDEKINEYIENINKSGLKGNLAVFYSVETSQKLKAYDSPEATEMNGYGKHIVNKTIPIQNKNQEAGKNRFYGEVIYNEGEKGGMFINKNFPMGIRAVQNIMSFRVSELTEEKKKELGIDQAEAFLEKVKLEKDEKAANQRSENFANYNNNEEVPTIACGGGAPVTETVAEASNNEDDDESPFRGASPF